MRCVRFLGLASVLLGLAAPASANHLDFFSDGGFFSFTDNITGPVTSVQTGDPGNILGGEREVTMDFISGDGMISSGIVGVSVGPGVVGEKPGSSLLFNNSVSSLGRLTLKYDGIGSEGLGGADFNSAWDAITVTFAGVQGHGNLSVAVEDTASHVGVFSQAVNSAGTLIYPFANPAYSGVDFSSINRVTLTLDTTEAASDFSISNVAREASLLPEPGTGVLILVGLAGMGLGMRRRV